MTTQTPDNELVELEHQFWRAIRDGDAETCLRLADDPCIVTGAQGAARIGRQAFAGMLKDSSWKLHRYELKDVQVLPVGEEVAIIAYRVSEELTVEGKPLTLEAVDSSTWVRRNGRWLCACHTEAIGGDPFGRDRQPIKRG
jgi:ketosteroid isomerase-like protein